MLNERPPSNVRQLSGTVAEMPREILAHRVRRLVREAIAAGRYKNEADVSKAAGRSPQWLSEFIIRAEADPSASFRNDTGEGLARALGISLAELVGEDSDDSTLPVDIYPARARAVRAARDLQFPEAAIQAVLREQRDDEPPAIYWFRRIEAEAERIRPATDLLRRDR